VNQVEHEEDELIEDETTNEQDYSEDLENNEPDFEEPASSSVQTTEATAKKLKFLAKNPWLIPIIIVVICFLTICVLIATDEEEVKASGNMCTYKISGLVKDSIVTIDNPQVELINCDATKDNYKVLKTIPFEKYVLGVALAEAGEDSPDEAIKSQIITTRTFTLARGLGMCPSNPGNCWLGYNQEENIIRIRACENDQVYWDYTEDIYKIAKTQKISYYSPEISANDSGATLWKSKLTDERIAEVEFLANEVMGKVMVDSSGSIIEADYNNTTSEGFRTDANSGLTFDQILVHTYGTIQIYSATCTSRSTVGNIDYGDYSLSSEGDIILNQRLDDFLASQGSSIEEYNNTILNNINNAGYGTRAGVVAAAVTLIGELGDKYDVRLPYYWGGGHDSSASLASGSWGGSATKTCNDEGTCYYYDGIDCSGFVSWAINNGGFIYSALSTSELTSLGKVTLSASSAVIQPGDLLLRSGHVKLVVAIDEENKKYITAEASGKDEGVKFGTMSFSGKSSKGNYWGINMDYLYNDSSKVRGQ
jgi:hypothetical protein